MNDSALTGNTVVDFSTTAAGALCTMMLSDHGARVIRVIDQHAQALRDGGFVVWDRGKECVQMSLDECLSAGTPAHEAWRTLLQNADVVVDDFAPAAKQQSLVADAHLRRINDQIINCSITAYGKRGPWCDEPPVDELVLARTGVLGGMPGFRPAPVHVVHPLPSVGAAVLAATGIAAALFARATTGIARPVETSLMAGALLYHPKVASEGLARHTFQTNPSGSAPFYSVYECADGEWIQLGCVHAGFIAIAGEVLGITKTLSDPRFGEGRAPVSDADDQELRGILANVIKQRSQAAWAEAFEAADVPFAPARWTEQSLDDPQVTHNQMLVELDDPALGVVRSMGTAVTLTKTPGRARGPRQQALPPNTIPADLQPKDRATSVPAASTSQPPLAGVRVLEITNLIAGPTTGRLLADLGADVIKFEPPGGDMSRPIGRTYFYSVNFNKHSVCANTSTPEGKRVVQAIAAKSDLLVANLRPHATERMGINQALNSKLIEVHLTGYGWTGPYARRPGIDPLAQAYMGLERAQGGHGNPPVFPAQLAPTDFTTGAMGAFGAILALLVRTTRGITQRVESNLLNGGIMLTSAWFSAYRGRPARPLADAQQYGLSAFHRLYEVADGWIYVAADVQSARARLCELAGVTAELQTTQLQTAKDDTHPAQSQAARAFALFFSRMRRADALTLLSEHHIPAAPAERGDSEIFLNDEHAIASASVAETQHPRAGAMKVAWQYIQFGQTAPRVLMTTPLLGEHTRQVLEKVGLGDADISTLFANDTVRAEVP
tara:strand:+ start:4194 stop:6533 length:2340 start_codon:yes stop_codon:yes gene_type:complete